jgi:lysophospholipase L1-like esterase
MKPIQTLLFLVAIGILSLGLAMVMPKKGLELGPDLTLKFASLEKDTTPTPVIEKIEDLDSFLEELEVEIDSSAIKDSIRFARIAERQRLSKIQWLDNDRSPMQKVFEALTETKRHKKSKVRIMHFGDSQIEGDRITSVIRNELQKEYGGIGAGLIPAVEGVANASIKQTNSENWNRFTLFGRVDTNVQHKRYGPLCSFGMFTYPTDTTFTETKEAWVQFEPSKMTYFKTRKYTQATLYYGHNSQAFVTKVYVNDSTEKDSKIIPSTDGFNALTWSFDATPEKLTFEFLAKKSPEFYAFSFEGNYGVTVDNIGLRGSSGTLFKRLDGPQLKGFMKAQPIKLVILQYGGNTVPYITSEEKAVRYGNWFRSQIRYLQSINPNAAFIIIGPSDMATKIEGNYATYPYLTSVRDALKKAAFESGAGYWDLYEVMGGQNAMISWVEAEEPLAGKDYVHFNNKGTRKVSELFMKAIWHERDLWEQSLLPTPKDTTHVE